MDLRDKVAVVTGGAQGIGYAIAERFAQAGAKVVVADIDEARAITAAEHLTANGTETIAVRTDVTRAADVEAMVDQAVSSFGQVDVLVNNAGIIGESAPLWEVTDETWERTIEINLSSVFRCCRVVINHMRERGTGAIVNMASVSGKEGNANQIPYSVSKAGIITLTKGLAKEVLTDGVRVNAVAPALVETPLLSQMNSQYIEASRGKIPMGRLGRPEEVAAVVHFLASDEASFVTGQCYDVSGGRATY